MGFLHHTSLCLPLLLGEKNYRFSTAFKIKNTLQKTFEKKKKTLGVYIF